MPTFLGRRTPLSFSTREEGAAGDAMPRALGDDEAVFATTAEMFAISQRSNHATAFAGWVVTTCAMGLIIEAGTMRSVSHSPLGLLLLAGLLPLAAAAVRVVALLARAGGIATAAQEEFFRFIVTAPGVPATAWRRLEELIVAARHRELLTRRALTWAYATGIAFLAWSAAIAAVAGVH
jgi:hypothetical protein